MIEATRLRDLTASKSARLIRERQISPVDLVQALLNWSATVEPSVQAWEALDADRALEAARLAEAQVARGVDLGPLHGVPFGVKDIFDTAGLRTAAGFPPYDGRVPDEDAEVVARLRRAGAILLGKTVTTQFAYSDPPKTRNPWSAERTPGGSSSGSGAGVAAREMPLAVGSQTAGSVLRPAAYDGAVGFKPTRGRVSKRGAFPLAWSLDTVGVLARSVDDCALFFTATAGHDPRDPASSERPVPDVTPKADTSPPRLGLLRPALEISSGQVRAHLEDVAGRFRAAGAAVHDVALDVPLDLVAAVHHVTMQTECAAVHWQLLEQFPEQHGPKLRAYVEAGRLLPGTPYVHAQRLRPRIRQAVERALEGVDALLLPTAVDVAPSPDTTGDSSLQVPASLTGLPSISLPSGLSGERLPLAVQLVGRRWTEPDLLQAARWVEGVLGPMPAPPLP